ncbi:E3 ubiquitin-protein ligase [Lachnellula hyalina]|uniref:E3 ubiquitin-protein ligase n=1 Tax=Lachnellula hyalina TaxID=1316788 RepID=A0A8H8R6S7_9HELO|nr:E3 ubiquitin-protein ligase [Lachnellula hyalina]TVY29409.1 E3 ubiquitin-protein ligase [Lachnellula hyalina]
MYSVPSPPWNPTAAASPPLTSPSSPARPSRLRGLSYLRSYTQTHILSRDSQSHSHSPGSSRNSPNQHPSALSRATSYPSPSAAATQNIRQTSSTAQQSPIDSPLERTSDPEFPSFTSGWFPAVGGQSEPQSASTATAPASAVLSTNNSSAVASDLTASMARTRSATAEIAGDMPQVDGGGDIHHGQNAADNGRPSTHGMPHQLPSIRFTAHQDPRATRPSLAFIPTARILPTGGEIIKVGRYSERDSQPTAPANVPSAAPVGFKSKVVSRRHCEFWCVEGRWFIKDVRSSSGTFLNHIRLSSPGTESKPFPINDGDIVQLGIDFKGGEEEIFRCVKIRVELNKGWQNGPSSFNVQSHKRLRELNSNQGKSSLSGPSQDCSICLGPIAPCQSLFVAPCSHTWHYKCIRVIINGPHWPHFVCPNCRSVADLEAELEDPYADAENAGWEEVQAVDDSPVAADRPIQSPEPEGELEHETETTEALNTFLHAEGEDLELDHIEHSDGVDEASDDSSQAANHIVEDLEFLSVEQPPSPISSAGSQSDQISNSTVPPVNIGRPRGTHLEQPDPRRGRSRSRTPSPNGIPSSLSDVLVGAEGPMTPRNDAGPFVFDGSAGRSSGARLAAAMNLGAAADMPSPRSTPQPQPTS